MTDLWLAASIALILPFALAAIAIWRGPIAGRLAAVQLASVIAVLLLVAMDFAFDQPAAIDIALSLALLSLPGTLLYALFEERWL
ncbi:monovalent cation/H+ antiporter complex subunit F [Novosphingopyxis iocasae]|uniref:monovalent cation/H+ antiporter complex subunit F n=1 Tax=Novosphingopyxis iocasae TaxID=2762729 RepID=UPI00165117B6|nr:monovalent cation/H+ antiporter complex subunit F [Novosphingopyxis iocasae]|tara:strand:- start:149 stop:403 length:255 start_codon:yes stop_codon:yes gene_type:complete